MVQGKLYRSFIILQEDERGHSVSAEKPLSGYAKVEVKHDKCKVTFYAQNVKKDDYKCYMALIYGKKDMKQIINLGLMNINEQGKSEVTCEYDVNDIAGLGLSHDKISGAALYKEIDGKPIFLMVGFMTGEVPKDNWRCYKILHCKGSSKIDGKIKYKEEHKKYKKDDDKEVQKGELKIKIMEEKKIEFKDDKREEDTEEVKGNIIYEEQNEEKEAKEEKAVNCMEDKRGEDENESDEEFNEEIKKEELEINDIEIDSKDVRNDDDVSEESEDEINFEEDKLDENKFDEYEKEICDINTRDYEEEFILRGSVGEFFESIVEGFENVRNKFKDIKFCKWYKIPINNLDVMCNVSNYNKYTTLYYPMINYYPYIKKYGHFMVGFKCDEAGKVQYLVYAIPGKKDKMEQPYGGKSGFVTWAQDSSQDMNMGYWLMFYDFKNSMVVVPMK